MTIGVLKENPGETRVAMSPDTAKAFLALKLKVLVESGAGDGSFFGDSDYEQSGAQVIDRATVLSASDCLVMINALHPNELPGIKKGSIAIGHFQPYQQNELIDAFKTFGVTSFSLDLLPRTTLAQSMDILSSMSSVSGYKAVIQAADHLPRFFPMFMTAAGTIKPARVLILGGGVAGLQALATARRLGAVVEVFDVRSVVKEEVQSLGGKFIEVQGSMESEAAGGYAVEQSEAYQQQQRELIHNHAQKADCVICTAQIPGKKAPLLLYASTINVMQPGSVVVDLAAASGGNCELTVNNQVIRHNGITIIGNSSYPAAMPLDASRMFSNNLLNFTKLLIDSNGQFYLHFDDEIVSKTCLTHNGFIKHEAVAAFYEKNKIE